MSKQRLNNLFFFLGLAAVVVMLFTFDVSFVELWEHICHAGYWLIPIVGVWIIIYGINALAWQAIIHSELRRCGCTGVRGYENTSSTDTAADSNLVPPYPRTPVPPRTTKPRVSFWRIYRLTITGYALNYATPVGGLGGEPYRILELSKNISGQHAASSVILYAMMHFFAHFWFWFSSIFIYLGLAAVGDLPINTAIATVLGIIIVFCLIAFWIFSRGYRKGLVVSTLHLLGRIPGLKGWSSRLLENRGETLRNIDEQIASLYAEDKQAFYRSLLLEYLSRVVQSSEVLFMLLLFGIDCGGGFTGITLTYLHAILIVSFTTLFANLIGFLPMQLGVQEGGFVLSIAALGLSAALGIFVSIICRVREIIWIIIGIALMKIKD